MKMTVEKYTRILYNIHVYLCDKTYEWYCTYYITLQGIENEMFLTIYCSNGYLYITPYASI